MLTIVRLKRKKENENLTVSQHQALGFTFAAFLSKAENENSQMQPFGDLLPDAVLDNSSNSKPGCLVS